MKTSNIIVLSGLLASLFGAVAAHAQEVPPTDKPIVGRVFQSLHPNTTGKVLISSNGAMVSQEQSDRLDRKWAEANEWILKGNAQMKQKRVDEAIDAFKHALAITPYTSTPYLCLIDAYTAKGDLQNLAQTYRGLIYPAPNKNWSFSSSYDNQRLMRFALVLNQLGQTDEALTVYREGLGRINYESNGKPNRQNVLLLDTTFDGRDSDNVVSPARFEAAARTALGMDMRLLSDKEDAIKEFKLALAKNPRYAPAQLYLAVSLQERLTYYRDPSIKREEVTAAFNKAAQMANTTATRAEAKQRRGDF